MLTLNLAPSEVLQALPELENSLSLRELVVREEKLVAALDTFHQDGNDALKYITTLLRTHVHFMQNSRLELCLEDETQRIVKVLSSIIHGITTLGAAVLELLEERRIIYRTFPDGYTRSGCPGGGMNIIDDDEYYTV